MLSLSTDFQLVQSGAISLLILIHQVDEISEDPANMGLHCFLRNVIELLQSYSMCKHGKQTPLLDTCIVPLTNRENNRTIKNLLHSGKKN